MPASPRHPETSTLSSETDAQFRAQLAMVAKLEHQLIQQVEMAKANARVAGLEDQNASVYPTRQRGGVMPA